MNIDQIKKQFKEEYSEALEAVGNHMAIGLGKDASGNFTIEVRLNNNKLSSILPNYYCGFKVNITIIGAIIPL